MKKTDLQCAIATRPKTIAKMGKDEYLQVVLISSCISTALVLQFVKAVFFLHPICFLLYQYSGL